MSIAVQTRTRPDTPGRVEQPELRVTQVRVMRSEWAKLWSVRSTWITMAVLVLSVVGFGLIAAFQIRSQVQSGGPGVGGMDAYTIGLFGVQFSMLALGILGVLTASAEYTTGMIRSTLAAVPRRLPVLWAKAGVYGGVAFLVGLAGALVGFLISSAVLSGTPAAMVLSDHGVIPGLLGAGAYLGLIGVMGVALGSLLRSTTGGISALVGTFLLLPSLLPLVLPNSWEDDVLQFLPNNAGASIFALHHSAGTLSPGAGLLVFVAWAVLGLAGAAYRLIRQDA